LAAGYHNFRTICLGLSVLTLSLGLSNCGSEPEITASGNSTLVNLTSENTSVEDSQIENLKTNPTPDLSRFTFRHKCLPVSDLAERQIHRTEDKTWGIEYCGGRSMIKTETAELVFFTIEGACGENKDSPKGRCGNNWKRYLIAVEKGGAIEAIKIGGKSGFQTIEAQVDIQDGVLCLPGFDYKHSDPSNRPSQPKTRKFKIIENVFVESEN